jgi:hypothetical protein
MFWGAKKLQTFGYYNFDPMQIYLIETSKMPLALRAEWYSDGIRTVDYEILGIENTNQVIEQLSNSSANASINIATKKGQLKLQFIKKTKDNIATYKGRMVYYYAGILPVSGRAFKSKVTSINNLLKDVESNVANLNVGGKLM